MAENKVCAPVQSASGLFITPSLCSVARVNVSALQYVLHLQVKMNRNTNVLHQLVILSALAVTFKHTLTALTVSVTESVKASRRSCSSAALGSLLC